MIFVMKIALILGQIVTIIFIDFDMAQKNNSSTSGYA